MHVLLFLTPLPPIRTSLAFPPFYLRSHLAFVTSIKDSHNPKLIQDYGLACHSQDLCGPWEAKVWEKHQLQPIAMLEQVCSQSAT